MTAHEIATIDYIRTSADAGESIIIYTRDLTLDSPLLGTPGMQPVAPRRSRATSGEEVSAQGAVSSTGSLGVVVGVPVVDATLAASGPVVGDE